MKIAGIVIGAIVVVALAGFLIMGKSPQQTNPTPTVQQTTGTGTTKMYTLADVAKHASESNCWLVINGKVYDVTSFVPQHPNPKIIEGCGKDATAMFEGVEKHQEKAVGMIDQFQIGTLSQ